MENCNHDKATEGNGMMLREPLLGRFDLLRRRSEWFFQGVEESSGPKEKERTSQQGTMYLCCSGADEREEITRTSEISGEQNQWKVHREGVRAGPCRPYRPSVGGLCTSHNRELEGISIERGKKQTNEHLEYNQDSRDWMAKLQGVQGREEQVKCHHKGATHQIQNVGHSEDKWPDLALYQINNSNKK